MSSVWPSKSLSMFNPNTPRFAIMRRRGRKIGVEASVVAAAISERFSPCTMLDTPKAITRPVGLRRE